MEVIYLGWTTDISGKKICRVFSFKNFTEAMQFVDSVAKAAEDVRHHPDIRISYNKVELELTTHDTGGISEKDFILAEKIDTIAPVTGR